MKKKLSFLLVTLFLFSAEAAEYIFTENIRSYPVGASFEWRIKDSWMVYDAREHQGAFWKYSYLSASIAAATHGMTEVELSVFPISIFEISFARNWTQRYYESKVLDCELYLCSGLITRDVVRYQLIAKQGEILIVPSYEAFIVRNSDNSKSFSDEVENLLASKGVDQLGVRKLFVGTQIENYTYGFYGKWASYKESEQSSQSLYLVGKLKKGTWNFAVGAGVYKSSITSPGLSMFFNGKYYWGDGGLGL